MKKICKDCQIEKPISEFYEARGEAINPCKECRREQKRKGLTGLKRISGAPCVIIDK